MLRSAPPILCMVLLFFLFCLLLIPVFVSLRVGGGKWAKEGWGAAVISTKALSVSQHYFLAVLNSLSHWHLLTQPLGPGVPLPSGKPVGQSALSDNSKKASLPPWAFWPLVLGLASGNPYTIWAAASPWWLLISHIFLLRPFRSWHFLGTGNAQFITPGVKTQKRRWVC